MWSYLHAVFFMVSKGVASKRRLLVGMHLVMKRRNKAVARSIAGLLFNHTSHHHHTLRHREYEFSCSDSPDPASSFSWRGLAYFPCLGAGDDQVHEPAPHHRHNAASTKEPHMIEYYAAAAATAAAVGNSEPSSPGHQLVQDLAPADEEEEEELTLIPSRSPLLPSTSGDFSVRVSDFSSEEEGGLGSEAVDDEAEEFISRFYEQLRRQNHVAPPPCLP